jgi:hypothetical protein
MKLSLIEKIYIFGREEVSGNALVRTGDYGRDLLILNLDVTGGVHLQLTYKESPGSSRFVFPSYKPKLLYWRLVLHERHIPN